jgi:hypothetical protein
MDVADLDALIAAMENPAMGEAMVHDGVLPGTLVIDVPTDAVDAPAAGSTDLP